MPGLVGFVKPESSADSAQALLSRMTNALERDSRFQSASHHEQGVGLARVALGFLDPRASMVWNADESVCLIMEGELYDQTALEQALKDGRHDGPPVRSQAELVLRLYERFGEGFAARLNGAFLVAIWDRRSRTLALINDRFGLFPLYYTRVKGDLLFASGVRALLADTGVDRSVDLVAVNQFLVYDHMLDDRTLLDSVRLIPQGSILTFRDGQLSIRPYWTLRYPEVYEPQPEAAYVEQLVHHLRQSVSRQRPGNRPAGMLLSGGLDSRLLLGLLSELGSTVPTMTFGIPGCDDARVASEVAGALGAQHRFVELRADWLLRLAEEAVRMTDGLGNIVNLHVLAPLEAEQSGTEILYKGFMGDALLGFALKRQMWADYDADTRTEVHRGVHREQGVLNYDRAGQTKLLTDAFQARVGDAVYRTYREGMDRAGVSQLANQRLYFDLTQRVPRMTLNGVEAARGRAVVRLPFCDNDLLDFALKVPPGFLFERYLPKAALIRYFPRLARIPVAGTGRPLTSCARDVLIQVKGMISWHLEKRGLGRLAPGGQRPYKDYNNWFRNQLRPWVEDTLLNRRALDRGYFKPESVRQLLAEHAGGANHAVRLGALLTLELWHRQFVD